MHACSTYRTRPERCMLHMPCSHSRVTTAMKLSSVTICRYAWMLVLPAGGRVTAQQQTTQSRGRGGTALRCSKGTCLSVTDMWAGWDHYKMHAWHLRTPGLPAMLRGTVSLPSFVRLVQVQPRGACCYTVHYLIDVRTGTIMHGVRAFMCMFIGACSLRYTSSSYVLITRKPLNFRGSNKTLNVPQIIPALS